MMHLVQLADRKGGPVEQSHQFPFYLFTRADVAPFIQNQSFFILNRR